MTDLNTSTEATITDETAIGFIPCYRLPFLSLFHADCMEIMKQYPDKYFDLAIVDPPYGINIETSGTYFKQFKTKGWDNSIPSSEYFEELKRVSKNQIIWGGNYFLEYLGSSKCFLIWDKMIGEGMSFADGEMAWTSFQKPTRIKKLLSRSENGKIHPTQKPIDLYDWVINKYAEPNQKILDTHLGSGSIAIAVEKANRLDKMNLQFVGIEIDKEYFEKAINRIEQYCRQGTLSF
jgi:site-specific DNA-methyltransferase (adenine-specific)